MQILFQIDAQNDWEDPDFTKYTKDITFGDQEDYAKKLVTAVCAKHADIDAMLDAAGSLPEWQKRTLRCCVWRSVKCFIWTMCRTVSPSMRQ